MVASEYVRAHLAPTYCQLSVQPLVIWHFYRSRYEFLSLWSPFKFSKGAQWMHMCLSVSHRSSFISGTCRHIPCVSTKQVGAAPQPKHRIQRFTHPSNTSLLRGLASQPAPSMSAARHAAADDTCHSKVVSSHLCELGQSLSQEYCLRKGICVCRKFVQEEAKFLYQALYH